MPTINQNCLLSNLQFINNKPGVLLVNSNFLSHYKICQIYLNKSEVQLKVK